MTEDIPTGDSPSATDKRTAAHAISRMPREVRDRVSRALADGEDWHAVAEICEKAGYAGVNATNVTNYRQGKHAEWLAREERMEVIRPTSPSPARTGITMAHGLARDTGMAAASGRGSEPPAHITCVRVARRGAWSLGDNS